MIPLSSDIYSKLNLLFQDWADLIEYVLRKCTRVRTEHPNKEKKDTQKPVSEPLGIELT